MSKKLFYLIGIIATLGLATYAQMHFRCMNCEVTTIDPETDQTNNFKAAETNGFTFSKDGVGFFTNSNFDFRLNGFNSEQPVGDTVDQGIQELKDFLESHPNQKARITGICTADEKNTSAFPNLGYARANNVKNYFISKGISANRLATTGSIVDGWDVHESIVHGPINIDFISKPTENSVNWNALKAKMNKEPLQLEFDSGEASINLTDDQRNMISQITQYLDNVEGSKISIVGHTDNVGDRQSNINLGLNRAKFAKAYLVKNGVLADRIDVSSEGPDQPIADNSLESGRMKNRRTVVLLK